MTTKNELQKTIEEQEFLLAQINSLVNQYIYMTTSDLNGNIVDVSQAYLDFTGYKKDELIGKNHSVFKNEKTDPDIFKNMWETISRDEIWRGEIRNYKNSKEEYWISVVIAPLYNKDNYKIGYTSIIEDITDKRRLEKLSVTDSLTLLHNKRYFNHYMKRELKRSIFTKGTFSLFLIGIDHFREYVEYYGNNTTDDTLVKVASKMNDTIGKKVDDIFRISDEKFAVVILDKKDEDIIKIADELVKSIESLKIYHEKNFNVSKYVTISIGVINLYNHLHNIRSGDLYNIVQNNLVNAKKFGGNRFVFDINEFYVKNMTNKDSITNLPNRDSLVHEISLLKDDAMLMILHINHIVHIKSIYGFDVVKDIVLTKSKNLSEIIIDGEASLYSLNLQEFAILVTNKFLFDKYLSLLKYSILMDGLHENVCLNNDDNSCKIADFTAGVSYGIENIFNHADVVLQEAIIEKKSYKIYKSSQLAKQQEETIMKRMKVYKNALHSGNIIPFFQPIIDTKDGKIIKYEALARLETDSGEIVTPYHFLDSAKEDKTFEYFTRQMMQKVFNIYAANKVNIAMNLSYENISSESMCHYIKNRLERYGGDRMTFEIVESEDILDYKIIQDFIKMVKKYGCKVSIDDFGSGYSNFTNIIKLDIDYIKLDGTLIEKLNTDKNVLNMVKGLLTYTKAANIKTIAEFVSSKEIADKVKELDIDYSQGYFYGEPKFPKSYGLI